MASSTHLDAVFAPLRQWLTEERAVYCYQYDILHSVLLRRAYAVKCQLGGTLSWLVHLNDNKTILTFGARDYVAVPADGTLRAMTTSGGRPVLTIFSLQPVPTVPLPAVCADGLLYAPARELRIITPR
jgi:hypothetical protein